MGSKATLSALKPVVVALCVTVLAAFQALSRSDVRQSNGLAAGASRITIPEDDPSTPRPKVQREVSDGGVRYTSTVAAPAPVAPQQAPERAPSHRNAAPADKIALLIGINNAPGSTPLEGSITDVKNMNAALLKFGFQEKNIQVLTEGAAHRGAILGALDSLANRSKSKGVAVFLLATHSGQSDGNLTFATGGGGRISRDELASRLGRVQGKLWSMLPTCYSAGYALPGIVGKNRIAIFSSSSDEYTWQIGGAGSWLVLWMIDYGLLEGRSPETSVEGLYRWTKAQLPKKAPDRVPIISDGVAGDLVLGGLPKPKPVATPKPVTAPKPAATTAPTPAPTPSTCGLFGGLFAGCR
jgi:hypothetical protein